MGAPETWVPAEATIPEEVIALVEVVPEEIIARAEAVPGVAIEVQVEALLDPQAEVDLLEEVGLLAEADLQVAEATNHIQH